PQRCAQAPLLPDLRCALGIIAHWLKTMYRGGLAKGLGAMTDRRSAHACASSDPVAMGRRTQGRFPFPRFSPAAARCRSSVVEHPLGKGEVVSSILTGSTRQAQQLTASLREHSLLSRDSHVNKACFPQLNWGKNRGICSAGVRVCKSEGPFPKLSKGGADG